jgi:hypothetical protein
MVTGNLWSVTDTAVDAITVHTLHNWLPVTQDVVEDDSDASALCRSDLYKWKFDPDLFYAFNHSHTSVKHYMATAALVARGLSVVIKGKVDKNTVAHH